MEIIVDCGTCQKKHAGTYLSIRKIGNSNTHDTVCEKCRTKEINEWVLNSKCLKCGKKFTSEDLEKENYEIKWDTRTNTFISWWYNPIEHKTSC